MRDKKKKAKLLDQRLGQKYPRLSVEQAGNNYFIVYYDDLEFYPWILQTYPKYTLYDLKEQKFCNKDKFDPTDLMEVKKIVDEIWK